MKVIFLEYTLNFSKLERRAENSRKLYNTAIFSIPLQYRITCSLSSVTFQEPVSKFVILFRHTVTQFKDPVIQDLTPSQIKVRSLYMSVCIILLRSEIKTR